jgi:uncharacterized membrane protein YgcG
VIVRRVSALLRCALLGLFALPLLAPVAAQAQWQRCAGQDQICRFEGQALVRYGADGRYAYRVVRNRIPCDHHEFGDPAYGVVKSCDFNYDLSQRDPGTPTDRDGWTYCASEGENCRVRGTARVRYGAEGRYEYRNVDGGVFCSARVFGDPAYGVHKTCEYMARGGGGGGWNGGGGRPGGGGGDGGYGRGWEYCGSEGGFCSFSGPGEVRYGVNGRYVVRRAINGMPCSVDAFGSDPAYGKEKSCFVNRRR